MSKTPAKLLDKVRQRIRLKGYSIRTEKSYVEWMRVFPRNAVFLYDNDVLVFAAQGFDLGRQGYVVYMNPILSKSKYSIQT